jgi:hypothetical protein
MHPPALVLLLLVLLSSPLSAATRDDLFNVRYGEVLVVKGGPVSYTAQVYNTLGLNDCPEKEWEALDPAKLKKEFKAKAVILNGPRYFLMDRNSLANPGEVATFGVLKLRHLADVQISPSTLLRGRSKPYTENHVKRKTEYVFRKGRTIYELVSPDGNTYVMQSYARNVDPKLSEPDLATLGKRLALPKGWKYRAVKLDKDFVLRADGSAWVIQDELENTYQRSEKR